MRSGVKASEISDSKIEKIAEPLVGRIFRQYHPNEELFITTGGGPIDRHFGVDWFAQDNTDKITLLGSKIRRPANYTDITIEEFNDPKTGKIGDLYKSRMEEYLYGFISEDCTHLTRWILIKFQEICQLILGGIIPCTYQINKKHGKASFVTVESDIIPLQYIVGCNNFPVGESFYTKYTKIAPC